MEKNISDELLKMMYFGSPSISDQEYARLVESISLISTWYEQSEIFIKNNNLDHDTFSSSWEVNAQFRIMQEIMNKNRDIIERLRFIWWFSGWPIFNYMDPKTFPLLDPTYIRYKKINALTPKRFHYAAPPILGEAGWIVNKKIVNHDVAILQERLQFMYFSGIADHLDEHPHKTILEIGTGYGGSALAASQSFPNTTYILCDIPQSLAVAFCYLNIASPDKNHFVVTTEGICKVGSSGVLKNPEEVFKTPNAFIYLPNYLLPHYEWLINPQLVYNAMSLHEMHPNAIKYYCDLIPKLIRKTSGVFCEINTLPGVQNPHIDQLLLESFPHCFEVGLPSLAFRPRIWGVELSTIAKLKTIHNMMERHFPLNALFEFDFLFDYPKYDDNIIRELTRKYLDQYSGVSVLPPDGQALHGNHLRYIVQPRNAALEI